MQITTTEQARLAELETIIESNVALVGKALFEIRESRLYRQTHKTFEEYCQARFEMSRQHINKQIKAAEIIGNLETNSFQNPPKTETQARPLSKLPPADQPKAWEKANEIAKEEGKPVAARHVEQAVAETIDAVVVDGTKDEPTEERQSKVPKWQPDDAERLWTMARTDLDKILKADKSRERVLREVIKYAQNRIEKNK